MYRIDDKVQTDDERIGIVTEAELINCGSSSSKWQHILVCFPAQSTMNGPAEKFKAVLESSDSDPSRKLGKVFKSGYGAGSFM